MWVGRSRIERVKESHSGYSDCWLIAYWAYSLGIIEQLVSGLGLGYINGINRAENSFLAIYPSILLIHHCLITAKKLYPHLASVIERIH